MKQHSPQVDQCKCGSMMGCLDEVGEGYERALERHVRAAVAKARREQAEQDAKIAETIGCGPRKVEVLDSIKQTIPGCGHEVAFAIRQEVATLSEKKK